MYRLGHHWPFGPAAVLLAFMWLTNFATLPLVILLSPDGVLPARWRRVLWVYVAVTGVLLACVYAAVVRLMATGNTRAAGQAAAASGQLTALASRPVGAAWLSPIQSVIFPVLAVFWLSFTARLLLSWRRASIRQGSS